MKTETEIRAELELAKSKFAELEAEERAYSNSRAKLTKKEWEETATEKAYYNSVWERRMKEQHGYIEALWWVLRE